MADAQIVVSDLVATAQVGSVLLTWSVVDPGWNGLPYLTLDTVEIFSSASNDRSTATLARQGIVSALDSVTEGATRYYWARGRNKAGFYGDWYPLDPLAGISATSEFVTAAKTAIARLSDIAVNLGTITIGTLGAAVVYAGQINATQVNAGTLNVGVVYAGQINANQVNAGSLNAGVVYTGTLNASQVNAGTLGVGVIYAGTLNASQINAGTFGVGVVYAGTINASQINATTLAAISANLGTVTAGTINGLTINGGTLETATSGRRVVISDTNNAILIYGADGFLRATLGEFGPNIMNVIGYDSSVGDFKQNSGGGGDLRLALNAANGGYAAYATTGAYGPFTGSHDGLLKKAVAAELGDVMVDVRVLSRNGISDAMCEMAPADSPKQKTALGVLAARSPFGIDVSFASGLQPSEYADEFDRVTINAVGEGLINVCGANGAIDAGDLLTTSTVAGKAARQDDDLLHSYTVARAREGIAFAAPGDTGCIACIYLCG